MRSSYSKNNFNEIIKTISFFCKPRVIVEFGILDGYSLSSIVECNEGADIYAFDLFDDFPYNCANYDGIKNNPKFNNVRIEKANFYESVSIFENFEIDMLHIDIANNGYTYKFAFENYIDKLSPKGAMLLEGGSEERDNIEWMIKYNKPKIVPVLEEYENKFDIITIDSFPSMTIVKKNDPFI